jgi:hypothetical protein
MHEFTAEGLCYDQHCVWEGRGTILAVNISIFNNWPPTMLNMYAFYKKSMYIISMIV